MFASLMLPQCSHTSTDTKSRKCQHRNTIRGARDGTARTPFTTAPDRYGKSAKPPLLPLPRRFTILAISPAGLIAINARFETEGTTGGEHRQNEHLAPQIQISDFATTQLSTMALLVACARQTAPGRNDQSFTLNELLDKSWSQAPFPFSCPPPPQGTFLHSHGSTGFRIIIPTLQLFNTRQFSSIFRFWLRSRPSRAFRSSKFSRKKTRVPASARVRTP